MRLTYPPVSPLPSNGSRWYRNFNRLSIIYAFCLDLGPDLPWADEPSPGNLRFSAGRILTCLFAYSYRHSHCSTVHMSFRSCFCPYTMLPYHSYVLYAISSTCRIPLYCSSAFIHAVSCIHPRSSLHSSMQFPAFIHAVPCTHPRSSLHSSMQVPCTHPFMQFSLRKFGRKF